MWLASLVKFRHHCQAVTESFSIKDREVQGPRTSSWEYGAQALHLYEEILRILQTARDDNWGFREAFYDLCTLHKVRRSPNVLRDAFREATRGARKPLWDFWEGWKNWLCRWWVWMGRACPLSRRP